MKFAENGIKMGQSLPADDEDAVFWREVMRPISQAAGNDTGPCLLTDGSVYILARKCEGTWFRLGPGSDGNVSEPLPPKYRFYRTLAPFALLIGLLTASACVVMDGLHLCPLHPWGF